MTRPANENPELQGTLIYDKLYRDIDIQIPEETETDPYRFIPQFIMDQDAGRRTSTYQYNYTRARNLEHHVRYYQTITGLDHIMGEFLKDLEERGLMDNTVIVYGSDHGLLMGEYGMGGKSLLYDLTSKIPCFVFDSRLSKSKRGRQVDKLVSSLDFTKTILDYAGVDAVEFMDGQSLRPLVHGEEGPWRDELFLEILYTGRDNPFQEGIRIGNWKYIRMFDGVKKYKEEDVDFADRKPEFEMLFDLAADPGELNNLIKDMEDTKLLESFRQKTAAYSISLNEKREKYKAVVTTQSR
jgi:arylsulfatase A-like enzyme